MDAFSKDMAGSMTSIGETMGVIVAQFRGILHWNGRSAMKFASNWELININLFRDTV